MRETIINSVIGGEILSLQEVKDFLRVDISEDDDLITRMIASATKWCEDYISRDVIAKNRTYYQQSVFESFELLYSPINQVIEVTSNDEVIEYKLLGIKDVQIQLDANYTNVKVTYTTQGIDDELIRDAALSLIESYYDHRSNFIDNSSIEIPSGTKGKLQGFRKIRF